MANRSQKLKPKRSRQKPQDVKHQSVKKSKRGSWLASLLAIAILLSSAGLIAGGVWFSIQLFINPDQLSWLNELLPEWAQLSFSNRQPPQTLTQIQTSLSQQGRIAGEPLLLETESAKSFLLPIFKQRSICTSDCKSVVELRVYQLAPGFRHKPGAEKYQQLSQLPIQGPEEYFVIAPLVDADSDTQGSTIPLPLNEVGRFEGATPSPGIWFYLRGQRQQGTNAIAYGHVAHYNPKTSHLQLMLTWTSPPGQLPQWQQVTGDKTPELVVDQTVGLEPQLRLYQVSPVKFFLNPIELEQISISEPALNDPAFQDALLIARNGLWTPAWKWLQFIKKQRKGGMPASAQAQIDMIRFYSQLTQNQANTTWASPSQEVLADLIDGRWGEALKVFEASVENSQEIATFLEADTGRLWNRVEAALRINPNRPEVQAWGALILAAQQGKGRANSWLKEQPQKISPDSFAYIQSLIRRLDGQLATAPKIAPTHASRIVGSVAPITKVNPTEWLQPDPKAALQLGDGQVWYQVQVTGFHDGKRWLRFPFSDLTLPKTAPEKFLWQQLGLNVDPGMQLIIWLPDGQQQTITATVKAVQMRGGTLRLLAASSETIAQGNSDPLQPLPLALTTAALQWVQPSPVTLEELYQQQPQEVTAMLPLLWRELQKSGQSKSAAIPSLEQMRQQLGYWPVQVIDLTGNAKPEAVLTISTEAIVALNNLEVMAGDQQKNKPRPKTLIFSDNGKIIYSEFSQPLGRFLTAIATLEDGQPPALLIEDARNYTLQRWNAKKQRFE